MTKYKILGFALSILIVIAFGVAASFLLAQILIHNPPEQRNPIAESPTGYGLDYEQVTLTAQDGCNLSAWYIPSRNRAAIIVQHGYKSDRTSMLSRAEMLARHGYGVMMVDLRAHGDSDGDLISFGLHEVLDVDATYEYLLNRPDVDPERIGALGTSMGGVVVVLYTAQNPNIKAVVSESTFVSLEDQIMAAVSDTFVPSFLLTPVIQWFAEREGGFRDKQVSAIEHIGAISPRPVFLMQGGKDTVIPFDSGQRLYDAAGEPRELWFEPDLDHAVFGEARAQEYETQVVAFFDRYLLGE